MKLQYFTSGAASPGVLHAQAQVGERYLARLVRSVNGARATSKALTACIGIVPQ